MNRIFFLICLMLLFSIPIYGGSNKVNSIVSTSGIIQEDIIGSLNLSQESLIEIALKNNLEIKAVEEDCEAENAKFLQDISPETPEYYLENSGMPKFSSVVKNYGERWTGIIQPFDFPLKWYYKGRVSRQKIKSAEMDYSMAKLELIERVREGYNRILMREKIKDYEEENLTLLKYFLEKAKLKYELGESPNIEVLKASVEVSKGETDRLIAENELELAKANLNFLINWDRKKPIKLIDGLKYEPVEFDLDELKMFALKRHPEIKSAEYVYSSMKTKKSLAWSGFLPDWYIGLFRVSYGDPNENKKWASQIGINIPLWFFLKQSGEIKQANAELRQAEAELNNQKNLILLKVGKAYRELKAFGKIVLMYEGSILKEAEEMYRIANISYAEGQAGYIELLEAQLTLTGTRKDYVRVLYDFRVALGALIKEVGGELPE